MQVGKLDSILGKCKMTFRNHSSLRVNFILITFVVYAFLVLMSVFRKAK